jgi:hypothetical protein
LAQLHRRIGFVTDFGAAACLVRADVPDHRTQMEQKAADRGRNPTKTYRATQIRTLSL